MLMVICGLLMLAAGATNAATGNQDEIQRVREQIQVIDRDLAILKEVTGSRLDAQDKRVGDLGISTAQQANYMGAISNVSTLVGAGITVIALIAGTAVLPLTQWSNPVDQACLYEGHRYLVGALTIIGRVEMVCRMEDGATRWSRSDG